MLPLLPTPRHIFQKPSIVESTRHCSIHITIFSEFSLMTFCIGCCVLVVVTKAFYFFISQCNVMVIKQWVLRFFSPLSLSYKTMVHCFNLALGKNDLNNVCLYYTFFFVVGRELLYFFFVVIGSLNLRKVCLLFHKRLKGD